MAGSPHSAPKARISVFHLCLSGSTQRSRGIGESQDDRSQLAPVCLAQRPRDVNDPVPQTPAILKLADFLGGIRNGQASVSKAGHGSPWATSPSSGERKPRTAHPLKKALILLAINLHVVSLKKAFGMKFHENRLYQEKCKLPCDSED